MILFLNFLVALATQFLFPPKRPTVEKGKLVDKNVEPSGYGTSMVMVAGRARLPVAPIYTKELRESKKTKKKKGQKTVTYSYFYTGTYEVAISLIKRASGERVGFFLEQIWCDNELYFDQGRDGSYIVREPNGAIKYQVNTGQSWRFRPGNSVQDVEDFVLENNGGSNIKYHDIAILHFEDLPILRWGHVPTIELVFRNDLDDNDPLLSHHNVIREILALGGIPSDYYLPEDNASVQIPGYKIVMDGGDLKSDIENILAYAENNYNESFGKFRSSKQSFQISASPHKYSYAANAISKDDITTSTENRVYKNNGFAIKFSDLNRSLDNTEYVHQIANDGTNETNVESVDLSNIAMNLTKAYQVGEYFTARNLYKFNTHQFTLSPRYDAQPQPNDVVLIKDDINAFTDIYGIVDSVTLNADWTTTLTCTDYPYQVDLEFLEDSDSTNALAFNFDPEGVNLIPIRVGRLNDSDFTYPVNYKAAYLVPNFNAGAMLVYISVDGGNTFRLGGEVADRAVYCELQSIVPSSPATQYDPNIQLDWQIDDTFYMKYIIDRSQPGAEADNGESSLLMVNPQNWEVLSFTSFQGLTSNTFRSTGLRRGFRGWTGGGSAINAGTRFILCKVDGLDLVDAIEVPASVPNNTTIHYKLAPLDNPSRFTSVKTFLYTSHF